MSPRDAGRGPALLLRCGCEVALPPEGGAICPVHGDVGVARPLRVPPPRIVGAASGPHVTPADLPPWTGRLAGPDAPKGAA